VAAVVLAVAEAPAAVGSLPGFELY